MNERIFEIFQSVGSEKGIKPSFYKNMRTEFITSFSSSLNSFQQCILILLKQLKEKGPSGKSYAIMYEKFINVISDTIYEESKKENPALQENEIIGLFENLISAYFESLLNLYSAGMLSTSITIKIAASRYNCIKEYNLSSYSFSSFRVKSQEQNFRKDIRESFGRHIEPNKIKICPKDNSPENLQFSPKHVIFRRKRDNCRKFASLNVHRKIQREPKISTNKYISS